MGIVHWLQGLLGRHSACATASAADARSPQPPLVTRQPSSAGPPASVSPTPAGESAAPSPVPEQPDARHSNTRVTPGETASGADAPLLADALGIKFRASVVQHEIHASGLGYPVRVTHPTFSQRQVYTWDVIIDRISDRTEKFLDGPSSSNLTFRGFARTEGWSGNKTFYASQVIQIVDQRTGEVIEGYARVCAWLARLVQAHQDNERRHRENERRQELAARRHRLGTTEQGILAEGLNHEVVVQQGDERYRAWIKEVERWGFGIKFTARAERIPVPGQRRWRGTKTFYPGNVTALEDPETGPVADFDAYLVEVARRGPTAVGQSPGDS